MRLLFLGLPGSGKGTQAKIFAHEFKCKLIGAGDILRRKKNEPTPTGKKICSIMQAGKLVPDSLIIEIIHAEIETCTQFILEGFPRTLQQAHALDAFLKNKKMNLDLIVELKIEEKIIQQRIQTRAIIEKRKDDNKKTLLARMETYRLETLPVDQWYTKHKNFICVDGTQSIENIHSEIIRRGNLSKLGGMQT